MKILTPKLDELFNVCNGDGSRMSKNLCAFVNQHKESWPARIQLLEDALLEVREILKK